MPEADLIMDCEVDRLKPHPSNPRKGDVPAIMQSLERFGQVKPLIVQRSTGFIVAGNHTFEAARRLGWAKVRVIVKDMDDDTARSYLLADNRTGDKATYDEGNLYKLLSETINLEGTGYDVDDMETLADALGGNVTAETDTGEVIRKKPDFSQTVHRSPKEALRDVVLLMPTSAAAEFGEQVAKLQNAYGTRTVVETVRRAVSEAAENL